MSSPPPRKNAEPPRRTAKPPYWKLSGDGSECTPPHYRF